jgi:hypothetical protein
MNPHVHGDSFQLHFAMAKDTPAFVQPDPIAQSLRDERSGKNIQQWSVCYVMR